MFTNARSIKTTKHVQAGIVHANNLKANVVESGTISSRGEVESPNVTLTNSTSRTLPDTGKGSVWSNSNKQLIFTDGDFTDTGDFSLEPVLSEGNDAHGKEMNNVSGVNFSLTSGIQAGDGATNTDPSAIAIGRSASTIGSNDIVIGNTGRTINVSYRSVAIGSSVDCRSHRNVLIGFDATQIFGSTGVALGSGVIGSNRGVAFGSGAQTDNNTSTGIGADSFCRNGVAIGANTTARSNVVAIGKDAFSDFSSAVVIGRDTLATGLSGIALGQNASTSTNEFTINLTGAAPSGTSGSLRTSFTTSTGGSLTGGGIATPATVARYLPVTIGGTEFKIPLYT